MEQRDKAKAKRFFDFLQTCFEQYQYWQLLERLSMTEEIFAIK
jgi:hypothetical protein